MPTINLEDIKAAVRAKYEPLTIEFGDHRVVMVQAIRLGEKQRRELARLQNEVNSIDKSAENALDQMVDGIAAIIRLAATNKSKADALVKAVDRDLATLLEVLKQYGEVTQLPEASPSPS